MPETGSDLAGRVKCLGRELGFSTVRITSAAPLEAERTRYLEWIADGRQGEMRWITPEHAERSTDPSTILPGVRAVICVGLPYWLGHRRPTPDNAGRIARYAWGKDYHTVMGGMLAALGERLKDELGGEYRWYVDTGPMLDKGLAARSGIGWYGRNTNLLSQPWGSFLFLGEILTTLDVPPDAPLARDCGSCRLCVVACPTGALDGDYRMDSRKCISYLTIEHRGPIPRELREQIGDWVFGCDICQDVCPPTMAPYLRSREDRSAWAQSVRSEVQGTRAAVEWTYDPKPGDHPLRSAESQTRQSVDLIWLLRLSHDQYVSAFRGSSVRRAKDWMLRRNAAVALGNVGTRTSFEPLVEACRYDQHPLVRSHAAWALGRLGTRFPQLPSRERLLEARDCEQDPVVGEEIEAALERRPW